MKKRFSIILVIISLLCWYEISSIANSYFVPSPEDIFLASQEILFGPDFWLDSISTITRILIGFVIGFTLAIVTGLFFEKVLPSSLVPFNAINFFRFIPPLAIVPLVILWFGIGETSKYIIIIFTVFFPTYISTIFGLQNINQKLIWVAKTTGATKIQMVHKVFLPGAMPFIANGARVGIGLAFSVIIAAELAGVYHGLGFRIWLFQSYFRADKLIVYIFLICVYGFIFDLIISKINTNLFFWGEKNEP